MCSGSDRSSGTRRRAGDSTASASGLLFPPLGSPPLEEQQPKVARAADSAAGRTSHEGVQQGTAGLTSETGATFSMTGIAPRTDADAAARVDDAAEWAVATLGVATRRGSLVEAAIEAFIRSASLWPRLDVTPAHPVPGQLSHENDLGVLISGSLSCRRLPGDARCKRRGRVCRQGNPEPGRTLS